MHGVCRVSTAGKHVRVLRPLLHTWSRILSQVQSTTSLDAAKSHTLDLQRRQPVLLHVIVLCQHWPHRLHKPHAFFPKIALSMRYSVCLHFVHI